jgi:hypothetical protein
MTTSFDLSEDTAMLSLRELVRLFGATEEAKLDPIFPAMKRHYELWLRYVELDYTDPRDEEARSRANEAERAWLWNTSSASPLRRSAASEQLLPIWSSLTGIPFQKQAASTWRRCCALRSSVDKT